jgi:hypothetical protein
MSDKISYILEVSDGYSKHTVGFRKKLYSLEKAAQTLEATLKRASSSLSLITFDKFTTKSRTFQKEIGSMGSAVRSLDKDLKSTAGSITKTAGLKSQISALGNSAGDVNKLAHSVRRLNGDMKSLNGRNVPSLKVGTVYDGSTSQSRASTRSKPTIVGAYTPIKFDPYEGKYVGRPKPDPSAMGYGVAGLIGKGLGV